MVLFTGGDYYMGNREDLLAGAQRCLYEKGYARTTARDIASASGVSFGRYRLSFWVGGGAVERGDDSVY